MTDEEKLNAEAAANTDRYKPHCSTPRHLYGYDQMCSSFVDGVMWARRQLATILSQTETVTKGVTEVGGTHYGDMPIEPWDFIYANHIPFDEGSAIKYLCRHKKKNGAEDVRKAISFCEHILETQYGKEEQK